MNRCFILSVCVFVFAMVSGGCDTTKKTDNQAPALESSEKENSNNQAPALERNEAENSNNQVPALERSEKENSNNQAQVKKAILNFGKESVERFEKMFQTGEFDFDVHGYNLSNILHYAAWTANLDRVQLLIEKGADVNAKSDKGITVLNKAVQRKNQEVVDWLKAHGAKE